VIVMVKIVKRDNQFLNILIVQFNSIHLIDMQAYQHRASCWISM